MLTLAINTQSDIYKVVLVAHILCAIIGFGGVTLNGVYGAQMRGRAARESAPIAQAVLRVSTVAEYFIYAVFLLGLALVPLGHNVFDFGQTWIWLSIVLFIAGLGISHGALRPRVKRMTALLTEQAATPAGADPRSPPPGWPPARSGARSCASPGGGAPRARSRGRR